MNCNRYHAYPKVVKLNTPAVIKHDLESLFLEWFSVQSKERGVERVNAYLKWSDSMTKYYDDNTIRCDLKK